MMTLAQHFQAEPLTTAAGFLLVVVLYVVVALLPVAAVIYAFYFLLTLPMRRSERTRQFLDLLELGLNDGRTPEAAIMEASASRDTSMGARFHLLAAHIQKGLRLGVALERVPGLLPPQVRAMLKAGERIGDVAKVIPACRQLLKDGVSQVRGALNYLILLVFCVTPFTIFVPVTLSVYVVPKYKEVFFGMGTGAIMPAFSRFVFSESRVFTGIQTAILCLIWLVLIAYVGGPRLHGWLSRWLPGLPDWLSFSLPWRRKRSQRDFSAMLAVLLDANVPEVEAVTLAADATNNSVFTRRAARVRALLNDGVKLPEALRTLDDSGELHWRLSNAMHRSGGFLRALAGWHEALDAKAFQLEQSAAQTATTMLVLFNGAVVACIVIAVFLVLIALINQASLW
jgi:type II secretory pathway component PulF